MMPKEPNGALIATVNMPIMFSYIIRFYKNMLQYKKEVGARGPKLGTRLYGQLL